MADCRGPGSGNPQDPRPKTQAPRLKPQDPRPKTLKTRADYLTLPTSHFDVKPLVPECFQLWVALVWVCETERNCV